MVERLLRFVSVDRENPSKRPADTRARDFHEIYADYIAEKAMEQASRCSQCGVPFCQVHCPLQNNIPDWLKLTAEGRLEEAYELSQATNNMPEICGRICPQDRLCEGNCVIEQSGFGTVTIGAVEKYITDTAWERGWVQPLKPRHVRLEHVGIVGAGPAGLAAGEELRRNGYRVTIYDRHDRAGGLLTYGIPNFKLEKDVVERRVRRLADGGIAFRLNFELGRDESLGAFRARHDAVFIAVGAYQPRAMEAPGVGLDGIVPALDYLIASNRNGFGDSVPDFDSGLLDAKDKHVVVIGGGDTAMDCVRTAMRQGAKSVSCLYRRDRDNMPGSLREVANAEEEGIVFEWLSLPKAFLGRGDIEGVRLARMRLGLPDASGRKAPEEIKGADTSLKADLAIMALGFDPEDLPAQFDAPELAVTRWSTLKTDPKSLMTNLEAFSRAATSRAARRWSSGPFATVATPPPRFIPIWARRSKCAPRRRRSDAMSDLVIRAAQDDDSENLIRLIGAVYAEYPGCVLDVDAEMPELRKPASAAEIDDGCWWVAESGREIVGSVAVVPEGENVVELKKLYVSPALRRRGLGAQLVALAEREARGRRASRVILWTDTRFADAHRLYARLGYVQAPRTRVLGDLSNTIEYHYSKELGA